jgi:hypothetical protein
MADKRRLPVIQEARRRLSEASTDAPPPWHWVPLGALVSIAVGAVLARCVWRPLQQRLVTELYQGAATREQVLRVDARLSDAARTAVLLKVALAGAVVALLSVAIGGFIVGRFGRGTNRRHGTLAGLTAMALVVLFTGRGATFTGLLGLAGLVVAGGLAGYLGARLGTWRREGTG